MMRRESITLAILAMCVCAGGTRAMQTPATPTEPLGPASPPTPKLVVPQIEDSPLDAEARQRLTRMLRDAMLIRDRAGRPELVRALRRLRDPALEPLFAQLAMGEDAALAAEGMLANAELEPERGLDLLQIRTQHVEQARDRVIRLAIEAGMLSVVQLEDVSRWPELDAGLVLLASGEIQRLGGKLARPRLEALLSADDAITALHAAAILNTGGPGELGGVRELARGVISRRAGELQEPKLRAEVERLLRQLATQQTIGGTAMAFAVYANETSGSLKDSALAALASIAGRDPVVAAILEKRLEIVAEPELRRRWALVMLEAAINRSGEMARRLGERMQGDSDARVALIGKAMTELDGAATGEARGLVELAGSQDFEAAMLALRGASQRPWQQAVVIRVAAATAAERTTDPGVLLLSEAAVSELCDDDASLVLPLVQRAIDGRSATLQRAIIAGTLRSGDSDCEQIAVAMRARQDELDPGARALAEILYARHASPDDCTPELARRLAQIAIERTELPTVWRAQAAWLALRVGGEDRAALARVLASIDLISTRREAAAPAVQPSTPANAPDRGRVDVPVSPE